jgi:hypothetical protein
MLEPPEIAASSKRPWLPRRTPRTPGILSESTFFRKSDPDPGFPLVPIRETGGKAIFALSRNFGNFRKVSKESGCVRTGFWPPDWQKTLDMERASGPKMTKLTKSGQIGKNNAKSPKSDKRSVFQEIGPPWGRGPGNRQKQSKIDEKGCNVPKKGYKFGQKSRKSRKIQKKSRGK